MNPWAGKEIRWAIPPRDSHGKRLIGPPEMHVASFNPGEIRVMQIARERGETTADLEAVHMLKTILDATIIDAEARPPKAAS